MEPTWFALFGIFIFWALAGALIYKRGKWHGVSFEGGMLMWRTKFGLRFIDRIGRTLRKFWLAFGSTAAAIGFVLMIFIFVALLWNVVYIFQHPGTALPGAKLVLPGITIPFIEGLIALFTVLLVHEPAHGLLMRAQGLRTKSIGLLLWTVIPGAFVEQDEKQLKQAPLMKRLRVYGAGSLANMVFALLCLGVILALVTPKPGVYVYGIEQGAPAENSLWLGARLIEIDNVPISGYEDYYDFMEEVVSGENLNILTENGLVTVTAAENYRYKIGIVPISAISHWEFTNPLFVMAAPAFELIGYPLFHPYAYSSMIPWGLVGVLKWMFILNFAMGLINLLPAVPLDGGYIFRGLLEKKVKKETARKVSYALALFILALIIINLFPTVWR